MAILEAQRMTSSPTLHWKYMRAENIGMFAVDLSYRIKWSESQTPHRSSCFPNACDVTQDIKKFWRPVQVVRIHTWILGRGRDMVGRTVTSCHMSKYWADGMCSLHPFIKINKNDLWQKNVMTSCVLTLESFLVLFPLEPRKILEHGVFSFLHLWASFCLATERLQEHDLFSFYFVWI